MATESVTKCGARLNAAEGEPGLAGWRRKRVVVMLRRWGKENLAIEANCLPENVALR